jgi:hypothetical protein
LSRNESKDLEDVLTVDDEREEGHSDRPEPPKNNIPVTIAAAVVTAGGVVATQILWPWTASTIHDGVQVMHISFTAMVLSIRRRRP